MDRREFLRSVAATVSVGGVLVGSRASAREQLLAALDRHEFRPPLRWLRVRGVRIHLSDWGDEYHDYDVELLVAPADERRVAEEWRDVAHLPADMWYAWGCPKDEFVSWDGMEGLFHANGRTYTARLVRIPTFAECAQKESRPG